LSEREQLIFDAAAIEYKYDGGHTAITPDLVINHRRGENNRGDLWTTFNHAQENVIRAFPQISSVPFVLDPLTGSGLSRLSWIEIDISSNRTSKTVFIITPPIFSEWVKGDFPKKQHCRSFNQDDSLQTRVWRSSTNRKSHVKLNQARGGNLFQSHSLLTL
jgi:hypothetical protein